MHSRNATSAVVSAGLRFLPYAGMLPSPWITCRMSWSCVSSPLFRVEVGIMRPNLPQEIGARLRIERCNDGQKREL